MELLLVSTICQIICQLCHLSGYDSVVTQVRRDYCWPGHYWFVIPPVSSSERNHSCLWWFPSAKCPIPRRECPQNGARRRQSPLFQRRFLHVDADILLFQNIGPWKTIKIKSAITQHDQLKTAASPMTTILVSVPCPGVPSPALMDMIFDHSFDRV